MLLFWVMLLMSVAGAQAQEMQYALYSDSDRPSASMLSSEEFTDLVHQTMEEWKIPGLAIGVINGDEVDAKGFGIATYPDILVTTKTLFGAGSTTKSQTAAALSFLTEDDTYPNLQWDTPISSVIRDDFVLMDEWATNHVTFIDALSHRTGMPRHDHSYGFVNATQRDIVRALRYLPLTQEPRTTWQYCNMMYAVTGHVIETVTGQGVQDFMREKLWEPFGMSNTFLSLETARNYMKSHTSVQLATPYRWVPDEDSDSQGHFAAEEAELPDATSSAGSVLSNVEDYVKYLQSMLDRELPISKSTYDELQTPRSIPPRSRQLIGDWTGPTLYSLGWQYTSYRGHESWGHGGSIKGYGTEMRYFPADQKAMVCFANTEISSNTACEILMYYIMDQQFNVPKGRRVDWSSRHREAEKRKAAELDLETSIARLFPAAPREDPVPLSVPLSVHTGTFKHPSYQSINVTIQLDLEGSKSLHVRMSPRMWTKGIAVHHVSGEWFIYESGSMFPESERISNPERYPSGDEFVKDTVGRALFGIGVDGKVSRVGMELEPSMVEKAVREGKPIEEGMIWFEREVDSGKA